MTQWGLDTLFNPAKRHMDEEKRRLQSTREQIGDNSGGRRIDLESGKVVIRKQDDEPDVETTDSDAKPDKRRGRRNAAKTAAGQAGPAATKDTGTADTGKGDTGKGKALLPGRSRAPRPSGLRNAASAAPPPDVT